MPKEKSPIREADADARAIAGGLLRQARFGSLGVISLESQAPMVTRVAVGTAPDGMPVTLVSQLSLHSAALRADPRCSLLVGEPGPKGDPLTHPRLTLNCRAEAVEKEPLKPLYLSQHPKAKLYFDFADFTILRLQVQDAFLNGGFGAAFRLTPEDLELGRSAA